MSGFDKSLTIEEVFAEADRRTKAKKVVTAKPSFEELLNSGDQVKSSADIRRSRRHDETLKKSSKTEIGSKTVKIDASNIIPPLRRSNRANKGKGKEIFDPSHIPSKFAKSSADEKNSKASSYTSSSSENEEEADDEEEDNKPLKQTTPKPKAKPVKKEVDIKKEVVPKKEVVNKKELSHLEYSLSESEPESEDIDDDDDDESYNDPNRLWCICKQPHNDRFMISCDKCQEWYHGDCVGITVYLGKKMEQRGEEYICPKCKEKKAKGKSGVKLKGYAAHDLERKKSIDLQKKGRKCTVANCNNIALDDSVYCSNVCILRHARESLQTKIASPKHEKKKLDKAARREKARERLMKKISDSSDIGRVAVFCCNSGKILSGSSAPLKSELKSFLSQNSSYQVLRLKKPLLLNQNKTQNNDPNSAATYTFDPDYKPEKQEQQQPVVEQKGRKHKLEPHRRSSGETKKIKKDKEHESHHRRHSSDSKPAKVSVHRSKSGEREREKEQKQDKKSNGQEDTVRKNVRKHLFEILSKRSDNSSDLKMHASSIEKLVKKIEDSLFKTYSGVGFKYKSKYRSITFNLKDEKNEGLWRKVIVGEVSSASLVKMSAEEMASKELAQWRKHELNQELELINKLETEKVRQRPTAKMTHKGEIMLDEDLSDLTHSHMGEKFSPTNAPSRIRRLSMNVQDEDDPNDQSLADTTDEHNNHLFDMNCRICTGQIKESDTPETSVKRSTSIILSNEAQTTVKEELTTEKLLQGITSKIKDKPASEIATIPSPKSNHSDEEMEANTPPGSPGDSFNESVVVEKKPKKRPSPTEKRFSKPDIHDLIWSGDISMTELSSFSTNAYAVHGDPKDIKPGMPASLILDGRIHPKVVWDYIKKIKTSINKEISVIQFHAASEGDKAGYIAMLTYFSSRKRFGVVNNQNPLKIKDIYLVPLLETQPIPEVLLSLKGLKFPSSRPSMLLGVLVLCKQQKHHITPMEKLGLPANSRVHSSHETVSRKISPESTKAKKLSIVQDFKKKTPEKEVYNPETANFGSLDESLPYDPESYEPEDESSKLKIIDDTAPYDPEQESERMELTEMEALKEKAAFLEQMKQKLDAQKAQLDKVETQHIQTEAPPPPPKKVDPRMAARMNKQTKKPNDDNNTPLQQILSVLNMESSKK